MITAGRLRLRHIETADLPHLAGWINDPTVRAGIGPYLPRSVPNQVKWFEKMLALPPDEQWFVIEVQEGGAWQMIGNCGFFAIDRHAQTVEVGIMIGERARWGQGYGTKTMLLLNELAFNTLNVNRIFLRVNENNLGAIRCYEKAGYRHEVRQRQAALVNGNYIDLLIMGTVRDEWLADKMRLSE